MFEEYPDIVSVKQLCRMLNIGRTTAYLLLKNGIICSLRIGYIYKIPKSAVITYLSNQTLNPAC